MIKKIIYLAICFLFIMSVSAPALAAESQWSGLSSYPIELQYVNINKVTCTLSISSDGEAIINSYLQKTKSGTNIYLESILQYNKNGLWLDIKSWSESSTSSTALISEAYTVSEGQYRVETYYSVVGKGSTESGTIYSKTVSYL